MDDKLKKRILDRKNEGTLRSLSINTLSIDFYSNDYLGFSKENFDAAEFTQGSTGSRLLSGNSVEAEKCEKSLSEFYDSQATLVYNSGYDANIGLISSVAQRGDYILYDEFIHASVRDGIRLSFSNAHSFTHNDCNDLKRQLKTVKGTVYIIVESLYSMDGDMAPLKGIGDLAQEYGAFLIVDEAHACGVYGSDGRGIIHARSMQNQVFCRVITFGKAYGFHGAAVLCSNELKEYLINFCRSFIYSTALPKESYTSIIHRVESGTIRERQIRLHDHISHFRDELHECKFLSEENSPIQVMEFKTKETLLRLVDKLIHVGIYTKPIFPPTIPKGSYRLRICLHSFNSIDEIKLLVSCLK
jgi:8-amino-7-oxononanoate synthase